MRTTRSLTVDRSLVSWPTPFDLNFMTRHSPSWNDTCRLRGDRGGKALLEAHRDTVVRVPFASAAVDVDTPEDYEAVRRLRG